MNRLISYHGVAFLYLLISSKQRVSTIFSMRRSFKVDNTKIIQDFPEEIFLKLISFYTKSKNQIYLVY